MHQEEKYCIDVFSESYPYFLGCSVCVKKASEYGTYYTIEADGKKECDRILHVCRKRKIRTRYYEKRWARNSGYRNAFFAANKPPYRCAYCGKYLNRKHMWVDHLVPVAMTKKSAHARHVLERRGIHDVNDPRNLVASCRKCNMKKSDRMGIWYIRGRLGQKSWYFPMISRLKKILIFAAFLLFIAAFAAAHA